MTCLETHGEALKPQAQDVQSCGCAFASDRQVEATSGEALLRARLLVRNAFSLHAVLGGTLHLIAALLFEILPFHFLKLAGESLDLVLVLVDLRLVHVELGSHRLHLVGLLLQVLLIHAQLLADLRTWGPSKQALEFDVDLLLLLNLNVLFNNLFGLLDEPLLERLDFLEQLPSFWVRALKLAPTVIVQRVFQLFRQGLDLELFGHQLSLQSECFLAKVTNLGCLVLDNSQLALEITDAELQQLDVLKTLLVLELTLSQSSLKNLDLLVQQSQFVVSSDELRAKDVTLVDGLLHLLLGKFVFHGRVLDDVVKLDDLLLFLFDGLLGLLVRRNFRVQLDFDEVSFLDGHAVVEVLGSQSLIFSLNFFLELGDLVLSNFELAVQLSYIVLGFQQILRIQVFLGTDRFVEVLLLLELGFELDGFLLQLRHQVFLQLDLFEHAHELSLVLLGLLLVRVTLL